MNRRLIINPDWRPQHVERLRLLEERRKQRDFERRQNAFIWKTPRRTGEGLRWSEALKLWSVDEEDEKPTFQVGQKVTTVTKGVEFDQLMRGTWFPPWAGKIMTVSEVNGNTLHMEENHLSWSESWLVPIEKSSLLGDELFEI